MPRVVQKGRQEPDVAWLLDRVVEVERVRVQGCDDREQNHVAIQHSFENTLYTRCINVMHLVHRPRFSRHPRLRITLNTTHMPHKRARSSHTPPHNPRHCHPHLQTKMGAFLLSCPCCSKTSHHPIQSQRLLSHLRRHSPKHRGYL